MSDAGPTAACTAQIVSLEEIDSTSSEAMRRALAGEIGPLWIRADMQTGGRGRSGRTWLSPRGNLYASLLFAPQCSLAQAHQLSLLTGIAVYDTIRASGGAPAGLRLKWPNDVLIGRAKVAGILAESIRGRDDTLLAVVGVGINLSSSPEASGQATTHLAAHGSTVTPPAALEALAAVMSGWLDIWDRGLGFGLIRAAWLERAGPQGEMLAINAGASRVEGRFAGLDEDGSLLLKDPQGSARRFSFGDVTVLAGQAGA